MSRLSFTVIDGGRSNTPMPAYVPPRAPLSDDGDPARGLLTAAALSVPLWFGLAGLAWWAWGVTGCSK